MMRYGLVEGTAAAPAAEDEQDVPLLGKAEFLARTAAFAREDFPTHRGARPSAVRKFLGRLGKRSEHVSALLRDEADA